MKSIWCAIHLTGEFVVIPWAITMHCAAHNFGGLSVKIGTPQNNVIAAKKCLAWAQQKQYIKCNKKNSFKAKNLDSHLLGGMQLNQSLRDKYLAGTSFIQSLKSFAAFNNTAYLLKSLTRIQFTVAIGLHGVRWLTKVINGERGLAVNENVLSHTADLPRLVDQHVISSEFFRFFILFHFQCTACVWCN